MYFCTTAPLFVAAINSAIPKYLKLLAAMAIGFACIGVVLTISRTGVVTVGLVLLLTTLATLSYRMSIRRVVVGAVILAAATGILAKSWGTLKARFETASLKSEAGKGHSQGRGYYFRIAAAIVGDRWWFGVGPNNWSYLVSNRYGPRLGWRFVPYVGTGREPSDNVPPGANLDEAQAAPAHSLGALTAGEMGIPGLVLFGFLWIRWFQMGLGFLWPRTPDPMRRFGVGLLACTIGIFLQSFTEWVFWQTPIYFTFHILLGALASLYYAKHQAHKARATHGLQEGTAPLLAQAQT
jgi:hypothetical protein